MHVGVVGINHKLADLGLRDRLAKTCHRRFGSDRSAHSDHAFILLSTCNRTEIYFSSSSLSDTHTYILTILRNDLNEEFDQKLYSYFNDDCFLHLARVTCGLDSAVIFETEIQGQVKIAYAQACEYTSLPGALHFLFQKCLTVGKKMRSQFPLERGLPNVEQAIFSIGKQFFSNENEAKVLFVGASDINLKILYFLQHKGIKNISICNRTRSRSDLFSKKYGTSVLDWEHLNEWISFDWIIFGTKSPDYLITRSEKSEVTKPKLIMDLCVPRNVDPDLRKDPSVSLWDIDRINCLLKTRKNSLKQSIRSGNFYVEASTIKYLQLFKKKLTQSVSKHIA